MEANQEQVPAIEPASMPEYYDRHAARRARLDARRTARASRGGAWLGGAVLILLGSLFLLQNLNITTLENWWALFILLPALGAFSNAWRAYQGGRAFSAPVRASLLSGVILTLVTAIFLFGLDWLVLGPVLLIVGGLGLLINGVLPK